MTTTTKTVQPKYHTYNKDSMVPTHEYDEHYLAPKFSVFRQTYLLDRSTVGEFATVEEAYNFITDYMNLVNLDQDVLVLVDHTERTEEEFQPSIKQQA